MLTIAGSDSGGAAGLQADLKTFAALGVYGMSVVTAVTAQSSQTVAGVQYLPADFVAAQMEAVLADYGSVAIKTGFIGRIEIINQIAELLAIYKASGKQKVFVVVDPILVNHQGLAMFDPAVIVAYQTQLLPLADLVTPNLREAELLSDKKLTGLAMIEMALPILHSFGSRWILVKGHRSGAEMVDLLYDGQEISLIRSPYFETENTHGSGDTLSAAICAYLAKGYKMVHAVEAAAKFTSSAISQARNWRLGSGHGPLNHWVEPDQ